MNAEVKAKWVHALRSGAYQQGRSFLRPTENSYCCLGVLCDILNAGGWQQLPGGFTNDKFGEGLPPSVAEQSDISKGEQEALYELNDEERRSFNEIADYIEKEL